MTNDNHEPATEILRKIYAWASIADPAKTDSLNTTLTNIADAAYRALQYEEKQQ